MYFPDIKFNKNNTAQLVKWFSNFRWVMYNFEFIVAVTANGLSKLYIVLYKRLVFAQYSTVLSRVLYAKNKKISEIF